MSNFIQRVAAVSGTAFAVLWCADYVSLGIVLLFWTELEPSWSPSVSQILAQSILFGALFAGFVPVRATAIRGMSFAVVAGLFAWFPQNLYLFNRAPILDWNLRYFLVLLAVTVGTVIQWSLIGYLAGRLCRAIGSKQRATSY
jgi:hypothetical protein